MQTDADQAIEIWKVKRLIKAMESARGNGTSMISLILPPKSQVGLQITLGTRSCCMHPPCHAFQGGCVRELLQIAQTQAMLANEYGTASNIKSRVNRQSVLAAITSAQQRLKLYNKVRTLLLEVLVSRGGGCVVGKGEKQAGYAPLTDVQ